MYLPLPTTLNNILLLYPIGPIVTTVPYCNSLPTPFSPTVSSYCYPQIFVLIPLSHFPPTIEQDLIPREKLLIKETKIEHDYIVQYTDTRSVESYDAGTIR